MNKWCVVQTQRCMEDKAAYQLRSQDFRTFLPRYEKTRRHARRVETVLRPLFPGYLFVSIDPSVQQWRSINSTIGVTRLICVGDRPIPLPAKVIDEIMSRADAQGTVKLRPKKLSAGDRVHIIRGVFSEHEGLFEEHVDENRVILLLNLLGRKVRTQVCINALDLVD
jgi:transcriptional antiterminator RfaH